MLLYKLLLSVGILCLCGSCQMPQFLSLKVPAIESIYVVPIQPVLPIMLEENYETSIVLNEPARRLNKWMQGENQTNKKEHDVYLRLDAKHKRGLL